MISLYTTTALIGLGLAVIIMWLLRRDHLRMIHGLFWLSVAAVAAILGLWPGLIDSASQFFGVSYPPTFLFLVATIVLLLKVLNTDIEHTRMERNIRLLTQRLAIYDLKLSVQPDERNVEK